MSAAESNLFKALHASGYEHPTDNLIQVAEFDECFVTIWSDDNIEGNYMLSVVYKDDNGGAEFEGHPRLDSTNIKQVRSAFSTICYDVC